MPEVKVGEGASLEGNQFMPLASCHSQQPTKGGRREGKKKDKKFKKIILANIHTHYMCGKFNICKNEVILL